ncbi:MAG: hypothetical protein R3351_08955 [Nitrospirales bacterium]|nr:hypothetical protein [Nitrospirales bacterium]
MEIIKKQNFLNDLNTSKDLVGSLSNPCSRCGGLVVLTYCVDPNQGGWEFQIPVGRCLQCGDLVDATILKNRELSQIQHSIN